jgi:hypothetical protein
MFNEISRFSRKARAKKEVCSVVGQQQQELLDLRQTTNKCIQLVESEFITKLNRY